MSNIITKSPIDSRMFIWFAEYENGDYLYEYDDKFNQFDDIQRDILKNFGLVGMDMIMKYDVATGIFDICGRRIELLFKDENDKVTKLTGNDVIYNDCISYKSAETILIGRNQGTSVITSYNFGYKAKLDNFNIKIIVHVPMNGRVNMDISINSESDIRGDLYIIRNNVVEKANSITLVDNHTSTVNWVVV